MNTENILQGECILIRSEIYVNNQWELYENLEDEAIYWIFSPAQEGVLGVEGLLIERAHSARQSQTGYIYTPQEKLLTIDRSTYLEDGFCDICEEDLFTIEPYLHCTQEPSIYHFTLQSEPDHPAPYFRYILQKIS